METLIIEGVPRSGTRFFCKYIEKQFNIKIFRIQNEINHYYKLYSQKKQNVSLDDTELIKDLLHEYNFKNRVGNVNLDRIIDKAERLTFPFLLKKILINRAKDLGFEGFGLKFDNPSGMDASRFFFPNCRIIHILRDGRDVHLSAVRCLNEGYHSVVLNAFFWKDLILERRNKSQKFQKKDFLEIRYEDVLCDPKKCFHKISVFLGNIHGKFQPMQIKSDNFGKWKVGMSYKDLVIYESIAGDILSDLGYVLKFTHHKKISSCYIKFYQLIEPVLILKQYLKKLISSKERNQVIHKVKLKISRYARK